jgi:ElaB/YqjD/DUF883 family membrane-anchored ribosome-binding protein
MMTLNVQTLSAELTALADQARELAREAGSRNDDMGARTLAGAFVEVGKLSDRLAKLQKAVQNNGTERSRRSR